MTKASDYRLDRAPTKVERAVALKLWQQDMTGKMSEIAVANLDIDNHHDPRELFKRAQIIITIIDWIRGNQ